MSSLFSLLFLSSSCQLPLARSPAMILALARRTAPLPPSFAFLFLSLLFPVIFPSDDQIDSRPKWEHRRPDLGLVDFVFVPADRAEYARGWETLAAKFSPQCLHSMQNAPFTVQRRIFSLGIQTYILITLACLPATLPNSIISWCRCIYMWQYKCFFALKTTG